MALAVLLYALGWLFSSHANQTQAHHAAHAPDEHASPPAVLKGELVPYVELNA